MSWNKVILIVLIIAVGLVAVSGMAFAQDDDGAKKQSRNIGYYIMASMPVGLFLILLSVLGWALVIEHFVNVRRDKVLPPEVIQEMEILFDDEDWEGALQFCETTPGFVTNVVGASLPRMSQGYDAMQAVAQQVGDEEAIKLQLKISFLSLIASIGPMLGLFGTVFGMVLAFDVIASKPGGANPQDLADGISQALVTTVMGLIVSIPNTIFYFFFKNRVTKLVLEAGVICSEFVDRFRPVEG